MSEKIRIGIRHGIWSTPIMFITGLILDLLRLTPEKYSPTETHLLFVKVAILVIIAPILEEFIQRFIPLFPMRWRKNNSLFLSVAFLITLGSSLAAFFLYRDNSYFKLVAFVFLIAAASMWLIRFFGQNAFVVWGVILANSALFGMSHGNVFNIFVQGIAGVILSHAYLKGGYISSVIAHATINMVSAIYLVLITALQ